ncbi:MAG TPA: hypothetical protein VFT70_18170 [Nocardioides sp.]|nr:hypothetical protein [Nocardioides sp.]
MTTYEPTVHTQADLHEVWRHLMEPLGFSDHSIWMLRIDAARRALPQVVQIAEAEDLPATVEGHGLPEVLRMLDASEPGHSYAFLRSRPGRGVTRADRAWAAFLYDAGRVAGVEVEVVHLATDEDIVPLPLDEVPERRSA